MWCQIAPYQHQATSLHHELHHVYSRNLFMSQLNHENKFAPIYFLKNKKASVRKQPSRAFFFPFTRLLRRVWEPRLRPSVHSGGWQGPDHARARQRRTNLRRRDGQRPPKSTSLFLSSPAVLTTEDPTLSYLLLSLFSLD
jgi:hypothetical protein